MSEAPPPSGRVLLILARYGARRWINRVFGLWGALFRRKKGKGRTATPGRSRKGGLFVIFFTAMMLWSAFFMAGRLVGNVAAAFKAREAVDAGIVEVGSITYWHLESAERSRQEAIEKGAAPGDILRLEEIPHIGMLADDTGEIRFGNLREYLDHLFRREARRRHRLSGAEADDFVADRLEQFERHGLRRFREARHDTDLFLPSVGNWPGGEHAGPFVQTLGLVLLLCAVAMGLLSLTSAAWSSGQAGWNMEWLYTFPIRAKTLLMARVLEYGLLHAFSWFVFVPLLVVIFWTAGFGAAGIPLAVACTLGINLMIAAGVVLAETWLRLKLARGHIKNLQAACSLSAMAALFTIFFLAQTTTPIGWFVDIARTLPAALFWFPASLPAQVCLGGMTAWIAAGAMAATVIAAVSGCVWAAARLLRRGLIAEAGAYRGARGRTVGPRRAPAGRAGIVWKELRLLLRDRNRLVTVLFVPLVIVGFNVFIHEGALGIFGKDYTHAAALAFGLGAYMMLTSAFQGLIFEQDAVWLLYTFPRPLHAILLPKTYLWMGVGLVYPVAILLVSAFAHPRLDAGMIPLAALVVAGVAIHAFVASGLGMLGTDVQERTPVRRPRTAYVYLYMLLAAMYAQAFYNPSAWGRIVQVALSSLLAVAVWQKVRDRIPYLLDPTRSPPPRVGLSDGLIAVLAFSSLQAVVFILATAEGSLPFGPRLLLAFVLSGTVVTAATLYFYWRGRVPDLLRTVGIRRGDPSVPAGGAVLNGILWGLGAALFGLGYLQVVDAVEPLRNYRDEMVRLSRIQLGDAGLWFVALGVLAAPVFEEYIFRGLVFRGMQRSLPAWAAVVGSAALFAIVHPPLSVLPVFVLGVATAMSFAKDRWLLPPVLAHLVYNAAIFAAG